MCRPIVLALAFLAGCDLLPPDLREQAYDPDGDGVPWPEDCDSDSAERFPGAVEIWYDGVDQDCGEDDDFDQDGDGYVPDEYDGMVTLGVEGSGSLPAGDCWDDDTETPIDYSVVSEALVDAEGQALAWTQPLASETHPGATDSWYDGVDQDCTGDDDFDQDGDGWAASSYPNRDGVFGEDCIDGAPYDADNPAGSDSSVVHPDADETWYDGTDQDCDDNDCDQDEDGLDADPENAGFCEQEDCDDTDATVGSGDGFGEVWYDGVDQDCDGNDGDQDGDGFWADDYEDRVADAGGVPLNIPEGAEGDCWDVPMEVEDPPDDLVAINGFEQVDAADVSPDATDAWYDGVDQDCAGDDDFDQDGDGAASSEWTARDGDTGEDCDDEDPGISPDVLESWYDGVDQNCDGNDGDQDSDGYWAEDYVERVLASGGTPLDVPPGQDGDCDDLDSATWPGATEYCDGADTDCDGVEDEDDAVDASTWYADGDADGFGDAMVSDVACYQPEAFVADSTDCDDGDALLNPFAAETCDGVDEDCDGLVDHEDPDITDAELWYPDADADGYGDASHAGEVYCSGSEPEGWTVDSTDCDDADASQYPSAAETCNGEDDDCDGTTDEDDAVDVLTWYADGDGDGWGDSAVTDIDCAQPLAFVGVDAVGDCDDSISSVYPGATEVVADGVDQDCDGGDTCFQDADGDGYGGSATLGSSDLDCTASGESSVDTDCDDSEASTYPGAAEGVADGVDGDCDGAELCYEDADGDGHGSSVTISSSDLDCAGSGESSVSTDCDDGLASTYPGATEVVADGVDGDCDGNELCYQDVDLDGWGTSTTVISSDTSCADSGESAQGSDCDDGESSTYPGATEVVADGVDQDCDSGDVCYEDLDGDGYGSTSTVVSADLSCADSGESTQDTDCDDGESSTYPGATEVVADGVDQDCDSGEVCFDDADGDGYGSTTTVSSADLDCTALGESAVDTDCDDGDVAQYPGADEHCDGEDDDCDGLVDGPVSVEAITWYADADGDGYGGTGVSEVACEARSGFVDNDGDCDDGDASVYPGASEIVADGVDQDCDGGEVCYEDADVDGYGNTATITSGDADCADAGESSVSDDCDDVLADINPGADEVCNGADDDCDGTVDEDDAVDAVTWYSDADGDGHGVSSDAFTQCVQPSGYVDASLGEDCDDTDASTYPGADETCDGADDDCDGEVDEDDALDASTWCADSDGDGYGVDDDLQVSCEQPSGYVATCGDCAGTDFDVNPGAGETCGNGVDDDCDGEAVGCTPMGDVGLSTADAIFIGEADDDVAGDSVAGAGDVDHDGYADLLVGAYSSDLAGYNAGAAYLVLGPVTGEVGLSSAHATFTGESIGDIAGGSVAGAGDTNGDGYDDVFIGASANDTNGGNAGAAYLVLGPVTGDIGLSSADARLFGEDSGDIAGWIVDGGLLDGDAFADLAVGSPQQDRSGSNAGVVYVQYGPISGDLDLASADAVVMGEVAGDTAGYSLSAKGDHDGDGVADLLVGAPYFDDGSSSDVGACYLLLGPVSGSIGLASADARLIGEDADDQAGYAISSAGDVDGDGVDDLLVGAWQRDVDGVSNAGSAYVVLGPVSGDVSLASADASVVGEDEDHRVGESVASAGDVDGDGSGDVLVGSSYDTDGGSYAGAAFLLLGPLTGDLSASVTSARFIGEEELDYAGVWVGGPGDVDADGYDDCLVGAPYNDRAGDSAGAAYLILGGGL